MQGHGNYGKTHVSGGELVCAVSIRVIPVDLIEVPLQWQLYPEHSDIEPKVDDVSVADRVFLPLKAHLTRCLGTGFPSV